MIQISRKCMSDRSALFYVICQACAFLFMLTACTGTAWRDDPAVEAVRIACKTQKGVDYNCVEREANSALNPEICRLVGISIDDMCLQAVYEAAGDPTICDRIYLQGVVPTCKAYYARILSTSTQPVKTPAALKLMETKQAMLPSPTLELAPTWTPHPTSAVTSQASPTAAFFFDLSIYDPDMYQPIDVSHNLPLIARSDKTVSLVFNFANMICFSSQVCCSLK